MSNGPSATVSVTGEPLRKKSRKEQRRIEAAKGQAERLALMKIPTAIQVLDKKDHKIQKLIGLSIKFTGEVEFRSKKVLELKMLLDLATDEDVKAIRLKKLTDFLESEAPIQGVIESSGTIPSHETFDFIARFNLNLQIIDDDCVVLEEDDEEDNEASLDESIRPVRPKRNCTRVLEKFGDDVDSEENNLYNYEDDSYLLHHDDPVLTQLRNEYDESLDPELFQQTNSSSNSNKQFTLVPGLTQPLYTEVPQSSQISNTSSTQFTSDHAKNHTAAPSNTPSNNTTRNNFNLNTPSTTDTTYPDRNTPFIPLTQEELQRRRQTLSITLPLQQHNTRLHNERLATNKNYHPLPLNVKSTNKPATRQSKPSSFNQLTNSSASSSSSSTKLKPLVDSDSDEDDVYAQHTAVNNEKKRKAAAKRR